MYGMPPDLRALSTSAFVLLTTFRRTGAPVGTPVWVVADGDDLLVTTPRGTGKVNRLRHTSRVTLAPCDFRGRVAADGVPIEATAVIDDGARRRERMEQGLVQKYGFVYKVIRAAGRLRRSAPDFVVIVISA